MMTPTTVSILRERHSLRICHTQNLQHTQKPADRQPQSLAQMTHGDGPCEVMITEKCVDTLPHETTDVQMTVWFHR